MVDDGFLCKNSNNLVIGANPCIFFLDRLWALSSLLFIWLSNLQQSGERKKTTDNCSEKRKNAVLAKTGLSVQKKLGLLERSGLEAQNIRSISLLGRCYHFLFLAWPSPSNLGAGRPGWEEDGKEGRAGD